MTTQVNGYTSVASVPWLDSTTDGLVRGITATLAQRHPNVLAILLYGSVARHDERPLDDPDPSDVDLLIIFDTVAPRLSFAEERAVFASIGLIRDHYIDTPREVQIMLASRTLAEWDSTFVVSVIQDALLLWARGPLPSLFAPIETRQSDLSLPTSLPGGPPTTSASEQTP